MIVRSQKPSKGLQKRFLRPRKTISALSVPSRAPIIWIGPAGVHVVEAENNVCGSFFKYAQMFRVNKIETRGGSRNGSMPCPRVFGCVDGRVLLSLKRFLGAVGVHR